jgi:hypothetical protein
LADSDRRSAFAALATYLQGARADLEKQALTQAPAGKIRLADAAEIASITELGILLDEYQEAVERIVYPHLSDPSIIPVHISTGVGQAVGTSVDEPALMNHLRASISKAADDYRKASELWPEAQQDALKYSPASALGSSLINVLSQSRLENILTGIPGNSLQEKMQYTIQRGLAGSVLSGMTHAELDRLLSDLGHESAAEQPEPSIRSRILVALGLASEEAGSLDAISHDAAQILAGKMRHNEFDVFMAHNSSDEESVRSICRSLQNHGIYPWIDVEQIRPGTWFQDAIQSAIRKVQAAAIVLGPEGVGRWQALEIRSFIEQCVDRGIPVIPVLLPGVAKIPDNLSFMKQLNCVKFEETVREEAALQKLIWGITGMRP